MVHKSFPCSTNPNQKITAWRPNCIIKVGKYKSEKEALLDLYDSEEDYHKYRMLKSRLKQKLYNLLFFTQDESRPAGFAQKKCFNLMHQGKSLVLLTEYRMAEQPYKKALDIAIRYEFTDNIIECLSNLNFIYSQLPDPKAFYYTLNSLKQYKKLKIEEDKAYEIYYSSKIELQKSVARQTEYLKKMPAFILELKQLWKKYKSYNLFYYYYMLNGYYFDLTGEYEKKIIEIKTCKKLLANGEVNTLRFPRELNQFLLPYTLLKAKKFTDGLRVASQYVNDFDPFSRNWFVYMKTYFLLTMYAGESWILFKAFLSFYDRSFNYPVKYHQLLNSVPKHSKDKLGHNISILILQFLYLLKNRDYEQLISKEETYRKYADSYLKDPYSRRSYYLFKMMLYIIRADFDRARSIKKGKPWLEKLKNTPEPGDAYAAVEIIPYEKLWEVMLGYLEE